MIWLYLFKFFHLFQTDIRICMHVVHSYDTHSRQVYGLLQSYLILLILNMNFEMLATIEFSSSYIATSTSNNYVAK